MKTMKLSQITIEMKEYNGSVAYGSECNAWQDFVEDCHKACGIAPWDDKAEETEVSAEFAKYWQAVANGSSSDYDNDGGRVDA